MTTKELKALNCLKEFRNNLLNCKPSGIGHPKMFVANSLAHIENIINILTDSIEPVPNTTTVSANLTSLEISYIKEWIGLSNFTGSDLKLCAILEKLEESV